MSGIDLLLETAVDYERTHQVVLYTLFEKSDLPKILTGIDRIRQTEWEPERQLFDLGLSNDKSRFLLEIKMWSPLTEQQLNRQVKFLQGHYGHRAGYVLLGTSWFEFDDQRIDKETKKLGKKYGYEQLIEALNNLLTRTGQQPDVYELALAYRNTLDKQFNELKNAVNSSKKDKLFYYSLFWHLKQQLNGFETEIYTTNNPGGPVYMLSLPSQSCESLDVYGIKTELYCEVVKDHLCIKFHADSKDAQIRRDIRDAVRRAVHAVLDNKFKLIDTGRLGKYMTACTVDHDFSDVANMAKSVKVFAEVKRSLPDIAKILKHVP